MSTITTGNDYQTECPACGAYIEGRCYMDNPSEGTWIVCPHCDSDIKIESIDYSYVIRLSKVESQNGITVQKDE